MLLFASASFLYFHSDFAKAAFGLYFLIQSLLNPAFKKTMLAFQKPMAKTIS